MVKTLIKKEDGKPHQLVIDKRTLPKTDNPPNIKHLRYSRKIPMKCDECPYRAKEESGNGLCTEYKKNSLCSIRADTLKLMETYETSNPNEILPLIKEQFKDNYIRLQFFSQLEDMSNKLDSEVTKRMNAMNNLAKTISEMQTKKNTIHVEEHKTLSEGKKDDISKMIYTLIQEKTDAT